VPGAGDGQPGRGCGAPARLVRETEIACSLCGNWTRGGQPAAWPPAARRFGVQAAGKRQCPAVAGRKVPCLRVGCSRRLLPTAPFAASRTMAVAAPARAWLPSAQQEADPTRAAAAGPASPAAPPRRAGPGPRQRTLSPPVSHDDERGPVSRVGEAAAFPARGAAVGGLHRPPAGGPSRRGAGRPAAVGGRVRTSCGRPDGRPLRGDAAHDRQLRPPECLRLAQALTVFSMVYQQTRAVQRP
jgi:hypothetical protein